MTEDQSDLVTSDPDAYTMEEDRAARVIQNAFRRLLDVNVFKYFKNLLSFKGQGDPRLLLKCINPKEMFAPKRKQFTPQGIRDVLQILSTVYKLPVIRVDSHVVYFSAADLAATNPPQNLHMLHVGLIDAATGVHVRFRLGGTKFPPNIYYKLFTHRPIVDLCANSPKDYTKQSLKQLLPRQIHNHGVIPEQDRDGWYTRVENNGWRLLTLRLPHSLDEVTAADNKKRLQFNHSRLQRKQEVLKKQKRRKIEWMRKMYDEGSLHAHTTEPNTAVLVQRATEGVIKSVEQHGTQAVLDWEVDELLNWTNALNYDEYISSWKAIGTSKSSCAFTGTTFVRSPYDLYECSQLSSPSLLSPTTSVKEAE